MSLSLATEAPEPSIAEALTQLESTICLVLLDVIALRSRVDGRTA